MKKLAKFVYLDSHESMNESEVTLNSVLHRIELSNQASITWTPFPVVGNEMWQFDRENSPWILTYKYLVYIPYFDSSHNLPTLFTSLSL